MARPSEACDHCDDGGLAGAGAAEERGDAGACLEGDIEGEIAAPVAQLDSEAQTIARPFRILRANTSERRSAPSEITIETRLSRIASRSPPGTCSAV